MKWVQNHRGVVSLAVAAVIAGVLLGLVLHVWLHDAEAVLGGVGNVTTGSNPHNLSSSATHGRTTSNEEQVCVFCHTPHHAIGAGDSTLIGPPLWNHTLSSASIDFSNLYSSVVNSTTMPTRAVDGASKLCMSCHDGTIGIGDLARRDINMSGSCIDTDGSFKEGGSCAANLTTSPTHHQFSVPMNSALLADSLSNCVGGRTSTRIKYPWETTASAGANANVVLRPTIQTYRSSNGITFNVSNTPTYQYKVGYYYGVQCSSCHDPHLYRAPHNGTAPENAKFLVDGYPSNTTPLCNACHTSNCP